MDQFWDRFQPLYAGVQGYRGVLLNVGWTVEYIMDWSGDPGQRIVLPKGSGQSPWIAETAPLTGSTEERMKEWRERFAKPVSVQRQTYGTWTYRDLKTLAQLIRKTASRRGIGDFKVGALTLAWPDPYGEQAPWATRHPEAFRHPPSGGFHYFDPGARLHADSTRMGGLPDGIREGTPVHQAFSTQWGSLSKAVGLDVIMLRDSFGMPVPYRRAGPFGLVAPSAQVVKSFTSNVAALVRETKLANPNSLLMMYSNAASAVADWRSNCFDLESIAKQGYLDIWVDQTWAGAWNEVGVRDGDFWNFPTLGWTYQLANTLTHAAVLADTRVRQYPLVETFDAWESWDVLHTAPERLRWGIWAYSHAAVKTPNGLKFPAGSYISWANQGKLLLSAEDVHFLASNLNAALEDAHETTEIYGPTLVYSRKSNQWQIEHATPDHDVKEWLDEQLGSVIKWPIPVLSATRLEWLPKVSSDLFIIQTPSHLSARETDYVEKLIGRGHPIAIFGSPDRGINPALAKLAGLSASSGPSASGPRLGAKPRIADVDGQLAQLATGIPRHFAIEDRPGANRLSNGATAVYSIAKESQLSINTFQHRKVVVWDPPEFEDVCCKPLREIWGGSGGAYALTTAALNLLLASQGSLHALQIDLNQTMNISAWRTRDGRIRVLAGNLEEGLRDDSDLSRHATLVLPAAWENAGFQDLWSARHFDRDDGKLTIQLNQAESVLLSGVR